MNLTREKVRTMPNLVERVEALSKQVQTYMILELLRDLKEKGYSLEQAIAEIKLIAATKQ